MMPFRHITYAFFVAILALQPSSQSGAQDTKEPYSICGADRGYTETDSLEAAEYLENKIIRSDEHPLLTNECVYARVNTTVVSLCNGKERNQTVSRAEVHHGVKKLIQDCGLEGGFTGSHYFGDLTISAYGVTGKRRPTFYKSTRPTPFPQPLRHLLWKRDCNLAFDGVSRTDCAWKYQMVNGECNGPMEASTGCQVFCEQRRTGFYGMETRLEGKAGDVIAPGNSAEITESTEYSVSHAFSIGAEGVFKEAIGAGVTYQWSTTETKGKSRTLTANDKTEEFYSRWVYFPRLIESCGTLQRRKAVPPPNCMGDICLRQMDYGCTGDLETIGNVCSLVPERNPAGEPVVVFAVRYEWGDGSPAPFEKQSRSYKEVCVRPEGPDGDEEKECMNAAPQNP